MNSTRRDSAKIIQLGIVFTTLIVLVLSTGCTSENKNENSELTSNQFEPLPDGSTFGDDFLNEEVFDDTGEITFAPDEFVVGAANSNVDTIGDDDLFVDNTTSNDFEDIQCGDSAQFPFGSADESTNFTCIDDSNFGSAGLPGFGGAQSELHLLLMQQLFVSQGLFGCDKAAHDYLNKAAKEGIPVKDMLGKAELGLVDCLRTLHALVANSRSYSAPARRQMSFNANSGWSAIFGKLKDLMF